MTTETEMGSEFSLYVEDLEHPTREKIALETLARYSGVDVSLFQPYILLTNFPHYVDRFAEKFKTTVHLGNVLRTAHCPENQISIIDYRVGSPMAALVVDVLSYTNPAAVVMLGLCGGLHRHHQVGEFLLPVAAIRDEGASRHYMPPQVPSLPAFMIQQMISEVLFKENINFKTGVIHTTDYRMWEFDSSFKNLLLSEKASAIDMESATLFTTGFRRKVPVGALMLISDLPLLPKGIKTSESARIVFENYTESHLQLGIQSLIHMQDRCRRQKINFRQFQF